MAARDADPTAVDPTSRARAPLGAGTARVEAADGRAGPAELGREVLARSLVRSRRGVYRRLHRTARCEHRQSSPFPRLSSAIPCDPLGAVQWVGFSYLLVLSVMLSPSGASRTCSAGNCSTRTASSSSSRLRVVRSRASTPHARCISCLQGLGAAMLQANSVAIIANRRAAGSLGKAIGIQGAAQASGSAFGPPVVGGADRDRRLASDLLRQRSRGPGRSGCRLLPDPPQPRPAGACSLRLGRARPVRACPRRAPGRGSRSATSWAGVRPRSWARSSGRARWAPPSSASSRRCGCR